MTHPNDTFPPNITGKNAIIIKGARQNNLQNISLALPKHRLVVITGPSGSGKSSLAFDTIYAEGQRRYLDSMSSYARHFLPEVQKPDVDQMHGLSPTISVEQKTTSSNLRSTVGTITEIYDHVRVVWAQIGTQFCYKCQTPLTSSNKERILQALAEFPPQTKYMILAPLIRNRKGEYRELLQNLRNDGFSRARIDGQFVNLDEVESLDLNIKHDIDVVIDRLIAPSDPNQDLCRLIYSVERALELGNKQMITLIPKTKEEDEREILYSTRHTCPTCNTAAPELTHQSFSFNSRSGWCKECQGTGVVEFLNSEKLLLDPHAPIATGTILPLGPHPSARGYKSFPLRQEMAALWAEIEKFVDPQTPWEKIREHRRRWILKGDTKFKGVERLVAQLHRNTDLKLAAHTIIHDCYEEVECPTCHGARLRPESQFVAVDGVFINDINHLQIDELLQRLEKVTLTPRQTKIAGEIFKEIKERLHFLAKIGLTYLTLGRSASTLSGGETQRIRLASQLGSGLSGILYVLDEPSIGLHQQDNHRLLHALKQLRDKGNTVVVVEHDRDTMQAADYIVDFGPGGGTQGGQLIAKGTYEELLNIPQSVTADYLAGRREIAPPVVRRPYDGPALVITGARANNLKNLTVRIPQNTFTCVAGISGAGKSTLVHSIIYPAIAGQLSYKHRLVGEHDSIQGLELFDKVIEIDQQPIGRTPRSNPATYTKLFDEIRKLFAELPSAKMYGFKASRFSFNTTGGRCEDCKGAGQNRIELGFLANTYVQCERCLGKRYNHTTLLIEYRGKNIADVLEMTVAQAYEFFKVHPKIAAILETLMAVGLDYIQLGQDSTLLSGGEAQRIKLSRELAKRATGKTLYILDEPSTGLHFDDIGKLLHVVQRLVDEGNTVLMIEHNIDIIRCADYVIDMGPVGGAAGGYIVAHGTPEELANDPNSVTGCYM